MTGSIDYEAVEIPEDKEPVDYSYAERRADVLERIKEAGHPKAVNQSDLADRYGCSQQNISKDMAAIAGFIDETLGDRRELATQAVLERSIQGLLDEGEWRQAAKTALEYDEWVRETKELDEMMDRIEQIEEERERAKYR